MPDEKTSSVKSDANESVSRIEKMMETFLSNAMTRIEKMESRMDDAFSNHEGKPHNDSDFTMLSKRLDALEAARGEEKREGAVEAKEGEHEQAVEKKAAGEEGVEAKGEEPAPEPKEKEPVPEEARPAEMAADRSDVAGGGEAQTGDGKSSKEYLGEERGENNLKSNDSARADSAEISALKERLAQLESSQKALSDDDNAKFAAAQALADKVYHAFGDSKGAPRWANGETLAAYTRRLVNPYKQHSAVWKDKDLKTMTIDVLNTVADQVYSDAMSVARTVEVIGAGQLRMDIEVDQETGRRTRRFSGDPEACWGMFKQQPRIITGINVKSDR